MLTGRTDKWLLVTVILLCLVGVLMVYSSSAILATVEASSQTAYLRALLPKLVLGVLCLAVLSQVPVRWFKGRAAIWALALAALALLVLVLPLGLTANGRGTKRFLDLGLLQVQPAEFARLGLVVFLSWYASRDEEWVEKGWRGLRWPLLAVFGLAALIALQPNLSSAALLILLGFGVLFLAGQPILRLALGALPVVLIPLVVQPYQLKRIQQFITQGGDGTLPYQVEQSLIALGSGGVTGKGLGEGLQKYFYLPFPHTDFILGVIGEELGFIGVFLLFVLFGIVIYRGLYIARNVSDRFAQLLAAGVTMSVAMNFLLHSVVTLGMGPVTGVPLPFISHGGSSLLVNLTAIGVLLSVSRLVRPPRKSPRALLSTERLLRNE
ncbi:MAG: cell division protein FtsW [Candidatus Eisenbacteria bacterium]|uniref:Probable peptidoglycan glycosyltransferase FtsW n=1 Tax=Eiseniibacteriota bacterium TaxID=2212470 RepID=A0A956RNX5_UNCEI|nr:cell division protein FtsW [Candidatus Eisenbacteria bacterium]